MFSITTIGNAVAGQTYEVICEASLRQGIQATPFFRWLNSDGDRVMNDDDISVGPGTASTLQMVFDILKLSHRGTYICEITLYSLALQQPLIISTNISLDVECKFQVAMAIISLATSINIGGLDYRTVSDMFLLESPKYEEH